MRQGIGGSHCVMCWESVIDLPGDVYIQLYCRERYCCDCLSAAFEHSLISEANFPLRCGCKERLDVRKIKYMLSQTLLERYNTVAPEWTSAYRTYCATCTQYLDSKKFLDAGG